MTDLERLLQLSVPAVAIAFTDAPPAGVAHVSSVAPASCAYWRHAQAGHVFYTEASDHVRCPIGAHTHGAHLNDVQKQELQGLIGTMVQLEYLDLSEVPHIPHRTQPLRCAVYAPAGKLPVAADVVLVRGNARQLMLLAEAAQRAGVAGLAPVMGRRKHGQTWYLPAGRVEPGERICDAAVREAREESGVPIVLDGVMRVQHTVRPDGARLRVLYHAHPADDTPPRTTPDEESLGAGWFTLEEMARLPLRGDEVEALCARALEGRVHPLALLGEE